MQDGGLVGVGVADLDDHEIASMTLRPLHLE
jgi:hypothetical protein